MDSILQTGTAKGSSGFRAAAGSAAAELQSTPGHTGTGQRKLKLWEECLKSHHSLARSIHKHASKGDVIHVAARAENTASRSWFKPSQRRSLSVELIQINACYW